MGKMVCVDEPLPTGIRASGDSGAEPVSRLLLAKASPDAEESVDVEPALARSITSVLEGILGPTELTALLEWVWYSGISCSDEDRDKRPVSSDVDDGAGVGIDDGTDETSYTAPLTASSRAKRAKSPAGSDPDSEVRLWVIARAASFKASPDRNFHVWANRSSWECSSSFSSISSARLSLTVYIMLSEFIHHLSRRAISRHNSTVV